MNTGLSHLFDVEAGLSLLPPRSGDLGDPSVPPFAVTLQNQCAFSIEAALLAIHLINRYRYHKEIMTSADITGCFLVAGKYEDGVTHPDSAKVAELAHLSEKEVFSSERQICRTLNFELRWANPMHFLRWFSHEADGWNSNTRRLAKAFLAAHAFNSDDSSKPSSLKAAAALFAAKSVTKSGPWTQYHIQVTRHPEAAVSGLSKEMIRVLSEVIISGTSPFGKLLTKEDVSLILGFPPGICTFRNKD